jgi:hypothetical protein
VNDAYQQKVTGHLRPPQGSCANIITHKYVQSVPGDEDRTHRDNLDSQRPMIEHHKPWTVSCICLHRDKSSTNLDAEEINSAKLRRRSFPARLTRRARHTMVRRPHCLSSDMASIEHSTHRSSIIEPAFLCRNRWTSKRTASGSGVLALLCLQHSKTVRF